MSRVVVFGAGGWIGSELCRLIPGAEPITRQACDMMVVDEIVEALGDADELHVINAAGRNINGVLGSYDDGKLATMTEDNLENSINLLRAFCKHDPAPGSSIILLSSCVPRLGVIGASVYSAVKASISGMVRSVAREIAPHRINCIELGYFEGGMIRDVPAPRLLSIVGNIPLRRLGDAESIAKTCEYLIGCPYATGGVIPLTGGL